MHNRGPVCRTAGRRGPIVPDILITAFTTLDPKVPISRWREVAPMRSRREETGLAHHNDLNRSSMFKIACPFMRSRLVRRSLMHGLRTIFIGGLRLALVLLDALLRIAHTGSVIC